MLHLREGIYEDFSWSGLYKHLVPCRFK